MTEVKVTEVVGSLETGGMYGETSHIWTLDGSRGEDILSCSPPGAIGVSGCRPRGRWRITVEFTPDE